MTSQIVILLRQFATEIPSYCIDTVLFGQVCDDRHSSSIFKILTFVVDALTIGVALLATIGFIHGAILIMTSRDRSDGKSRGIKRIIKTVIGLALYATYALNSTKPMIRPMLMAN